MLKSCKLIFIALAAISITGCVSVKQISISPTAMKQVKNKEVAVSQRAVPDFAAFTPGKAMFGALGGAAMVSAGNKIISTNNVEDPANYIAKQLNYNMAEKLGTKQKDELVVVSGDDIKKISRDSKSDLVLDVRTINWSFVYFPTSWDTYRVLYNARLRLIDAKNSSVIAESGCSYVPAQTPDSPSYNALMANNAERLKKELQKAADFCVGEFKSKALKI